MGKSKGSTVSSTAPDEQTAAYMRQLWGAAQGAAAAPGAPIDPMTSQAGGAYSNAARAGNLGFGALSGDQSAIASLMNPYQQNVLDQVNKHFGDVRSATMTGVNDAATKAGAFGGSRHGVAEGVALGEVGKAQGQQLADITSQGYNDMMGRAGGMAGMGLAGAGGLAGLGQYSRQVAMENDPKMKQFTTLMQAMGAMPKGMTTTQTQTGGSDPFSGLLGLATTAGSLGFAPFSGGASMGLSPFVNMGIGGF